MQSESWREKERNKGFEEKTERKRKIKLKRMRDKDRKTELE